MATAFGPEGCVIMHMLAEIEPRTHVFNLDTGYQFQETLELRDRIAQRYGIEVEMRRTDTTVAEYEALHGGPLYKTNPDQCCFDRKVTVLRAVGGRLDGLDERHPPRPEHRPGRRADRRLGQEVRPGEDQPAGQLDQERRVEADHASRTFRTTRCTTKATRASAAGLARGR